MVTDTSLPYPLRRLVGVRHTSGSSQRCRLADMLISDRLLLPSDGGVAWLQFTVKGAAFTLIGVNLLYIYC